MSELDSRYKTTRIEEADAKSGFSCDKHPLDNYFARHAVYNNRVGIARVYVLRRTEQDPEEFPQILGFYTLSMTSLGSALIPPRLNKNRLPKYPMPVLLLGQFAIDKRVQNKGLGEKLLFDVFRRVCGMVDAENSAGCIGVVLDAKDEQAERFYTKYDFEIVEVDEVSQRKKMFLPLEDVRTAIDES